MRHMPTVSVRPSDEVFERLRALQGRYRARTTPGGMVRLIREDRRRGSGR
jgi:hypothetical protein